MDRASASGAEGYRFDSCPGYLKNDGPADVRRGRRASVLRPGVEPGTRPSRGRVMSGFTIEASVETAGIEPAQSACKAPSPPWHMRPRSTPGRTRTCDCLHVKEVPSPLGHGSIGQSSRPDLNRRPPVCENGELAGLLHGTIPVGPAGVEPALHRVSDGCLAARLRPASAPWTGLEPVSPARQAGRHTRCVPGRSRVSGGSRTRLSTVAGWCLGCSATDTSARTGGFEPTRPVLEAGCSPRSTSLTINHQLPRQDSNLHPSR